MRTLRLVKLNAQNVDSLMRLKKFIMTNFSAGDPIIYVPMHAEGDINHPDCERGFVSSVKPGIVFCRFFYPNGELRTTSCSEGCNPRDLVLDKERLK